MSNTVANYGAVVNQGLSGGDQTLDANSATNSRMLAQFAGASGLNAPSYIRSAQADNDRETGVVKQNFAASMAEESIRAQLHQQYMGMMWRELGYQKRSLKYQELGAIVGVGGGLLGSALDMPNVSKAASGISKATGNQQLDLGTSAGEQPKTGSPKRKQPDFDPQDPLGIGIRGINGDWAGETLPTVTGYTGG